MKTKILITGAFGQIGSELTPALQEKFGVDNVVLLSHRHKQSPENFKGIIETGDTVDINQMEKIIKKHQVNEIYHLASILSAKGEEDPNFTWQVNMSLKNILDLAVEYKLRVFWPSSIAVFGPTTPRNRTPQKTILEPNTMYGLTKVAGELLCQYYFIKYKLDVRSLRFPGLISWKAEPGGGTTDYAVGIFYGALEYGKYQCFVRQDTILPMMYMDDAVRSILELMNADQDKIKIRTSYNLAAISFSVKELADEIKKYVPLDVRYVPDHRQKIADSWPKSIDDSAAREDWYWQPQYDLPKMTKIMLEKLKIKLKLKLDK